MTDFDQLLRMVSQTGDDIQRAQHYILQLGDLIEFIVGTARDAWKDVPQIIQAFGRVGIR